MFAVCSAIPTIVDASFALPVLDGAMVPFGFQNFQEFLLNLLLFSKLEAFHPTDNVLIQLIGS